MKLFHARDHQPHPADPEHFSGRASMARMDRLFGVTMGEGGVSQLVSVDLKGAEALRVSA